jgi:FixJ family two-component response regulator
VTVPEPSPIVFVIDDDASVRESVEDIIRAEGWRPETFASARDFLALPPAQIPSCLILDAVLPDLDSLELQEQIAHDRADMPIIFISGRVDIPMTVRAMRAGAIEFLTKPFGGSVLIEAVRRAIDRSHAALREKAGLQALRDCEASLSDRERQVMALVVEGRLNKQVGAELGITEFTVKAHRGKVMGKMRAGSLAHLVMMNSRLHPERTTQL